MAENAWTGRLVRLRAIEPEDWEPFFLWSQDTYFERHDDSVHFPQSRERAKKWTAELATAEPKNDTYLWVIENLAGEFVGALNTHTCDPRQGTFRYGLAVRREHWRKGYASEAIYLVLRYYFHELRYQKVTVHIYDFNAPSLALHRRLGFKEEGHLRRMGYTEGAYYDWILLGMTSDEFDAVAPFRDTVSPFVEE